MKFFIPHAENDAQAERVLDSICKFVGSTVPARRVHMLHFKHNGKEFTVEVGKPAPTYYQEGEPVVIAIIPGDPYKICLPTRGVVSGEPILVGHNSVIEVWHFD